MAQNKNKNLLKKFIYIYLILCVIAGTAGTTIFFICANQKMIDVAEEYFSQNEDIKEQLGAYKIIKCEGRAPKADKVGLPVYFIVKNEIGKHRVTLWVKQKEDASHIVVAHLVETQS